MKFLTILILLCALVLCPASTQADYGCYPSYCENVYDGYYHYHYAGWWRGYYYPAGYYRYYNNCWYLRGYGHFAGYSYPYEVPPVVTPVVSVATVIPAYGTAYVPPTPGPTQAVQSGGQVPAAGSNPAPMQQDSGTNQILEELRKINGRLDALEGKAPTEPPPVTETPAPMPKADGLPALFSRSCAECHTAGKLDTKTKFVLVAADGKIAPLNGDQRLEVIRRINLKTDDPHVMPPAKATGKAKATASFDEALEVIDTMSRKP